jgi:hypothetical protein
MSLQGIFTALSGDDPNKEARAAERDARKAAKKAARAEFQYNKDLHNAEKANYFAEREYAYDTAITNWEYGKQIQDYQYAQSLAVYEKSKDIYGQQLGYNQQAAALAISGQQAAIQDLALSQAFQRESMHAELMTEIKRGGIQKLEQGAKLYGIKSNRRINDESIQQNLNEITKRNTFEKEAKFVEGLRESGKAALGQAGVSRKKALQSTAAQSFRDLVALDSSLSGARNKAAVDLLKTYVDASIGETQVGLNLDMIELGINAAKDEVKFNNRVLEANMQSAITQMNLNIQQIQLQKRGADLQAEANLNLFPEEFDYAPEPQMTPEREFVKPVMREVYVPKGPRVDTGFSSVAGGLMQIASFALGPGAAAFKALNFAAPAIGAAASGATAIGAAAASGAPAAGLSGNLLSGNTLGMSSSIS